MGESGVLSTRAVGSLVDGLVELGVLLADVLSLLLSVFVDVLLVVAVSVVVAVAVLLPVDASVMEGEALVSVVLDEVTVVS